MFRKLNIRGLPPWLSVTLAIGLSLMGVEWYAEGQYHLGSGEHLPEEASQEVVD
jgi:hypothetical protein